MARYRHPARTGVLTGRAARCLPLHALGRHDDRAQACQAVPRHGTRQEAKPGPTNKPVGRDQVRDRGQRANGAAVRDRSRGRRGALACCNTRPSVLAMITSLVRQRPRAARTPSLAAQPHRGAGRADVVRGRSRRGRRWTPGTRPCRPSAPGRRRHAGDRRHRVRVPGNERPGRRDGQPSHRSPICCMAWRAPRYDEPSTGLDEEFQLRRRSNELGTSATPNDDERSRLVRIAAVSALIGGLVALAARQVILARRRRPAVEEPPAPTRRLRAVSLHQAMTGISVTATVIAAAASVLALRPIYWPAVADSGPGGDTWNRAASAALQPPVSDLSTAPGRPTLAELDREQEALVTWLADLGKRHVQVQIAFAPDYNKLS